MGLRRWTCATLGQSTSGLLNCAARSWYKPIATRKLGTDFRLLLCGAHQRQLKGHCGKLVAEFEQRARCRIRTPKACRTLRPQICFLVGDGRRDGRTTAVQAWDHPRNQRPIITALIDERPTILLFAQVNLDIIPICAYFNQHIYVCVGTRDEHDGTSARSDQIGDRRAAPRILLELGVASVQRKQLVARE